MSLSPATVEAKPMTDQTTRRPVTLETLRRMSSDSQKFSCLACYDANTARWLERAGVHLLLMGDSAAEIVLGLGRTIDMPLDLSLALTAAVKRGAPSCVVMADMPFLTYQVEDAEAVRNAGRYMREGLADIVKIEADTTYAPLVTRLCRAGIPVCAHVGLSPQRKALVGQYKWVGQTAVEAQRVIRDALVLERAGAAMLLLEAVPDEVTEAIMAQTKVPVIGIGAGTACHGQILVAHDLLGLTDSVPRFAEPVARMGPAIQQAAEEWVQRVASGQIGGKRYEMPPEESARMPGTNKAQP